MIGGASLWMTKGHPAQELDAAKTFLLWFTNTENMVRWHKGTGYFPVRKSAVDVVEDQHWFKKNPAYRAAFDQLLQTKVNRPPREPLSDRSRSFDHHLRRGPEDLRRDPG